MLFVGYNPSLRSAQLGHHFAGRNNGFWRIMADSHLTPERLKPEQDHQLIDLGMGITNIVSRPTRSAAELSAKEYREGSMQLREKLSRFQPRIVCYVGIGVYRAFSRRKDVSYGVQEQSVVPGTVDFVAPSTSGLNRMPYQEQLHVYSQLGRIVKELKEQDNRRLTSTWQGNHALHVEEQLVPNSHLRSG